MVACSNVIWFRILVILPFTSILTFAVTLIICSQMSYNAQSKAVPPFISDLGTGQGHNYFMVGLIILVPQLVCVFIGRVQCLLQSQTIVRPVIILLIHSIVPICCVFYLMMAIANSDDYKIVHGVGAFGTFATLALYCSIHTALIIYLFIHRSEAPEYSSITLLVWYIGTTVILDVSCIVLVIIKASIAEYTAAGAPFLYFLGFLPQFFARAKSNSNSIYPNAVSDNLPTVQT